MVSVYRKCKKKKKLPFLAILDPINKKNRFFGHAVIIVGIRVLNLDIKFRTESQEMEV